MKQNHKSIIADNLTNAARVIGWVNREGKPNQSEISRRASVDQKTVGYVLDPDSAVDSSLTVIEKIAQSMGLSL